MDRRQHIFRNCLRFLQYIHYFLVIGVEKGIDHRVKLIDKFVKTSYQKRPIVNYNNVLAMLPLAIEDIKTRLLLGETEEKNVKFQIRIVVTHFLSNIYAAYHCGGKGTVCSRNKRNPLCLLRMFLMIC